MLTKHIYKITQSQQVYTEKDFWKRFSTRPGSSSCRVTYRAITKKAMDMASNKMWILNYERLQYTSATS